MRIAKSPGIGSSIGSCVHRNRKDAPPFPPLRKQGSEQVASEIAISALWLTRQIIAGPICTFVTPTTTHEASGRLSDFGTLVVGIPRRSEGGESETQIYFRFSMGQSDRPTSWVDRWRIQFASSCRCSATLRSQNTGCNRQHRRNSSMSTCS